MATDNQSGALPPSSGLAPTPPASPAAPPPTTTAMASPPAAPAPVAPVTQAPTPPSPEQTAQAANVARDSFFGRAVRSLFGNSVEYKAGPNGVEPVEIREKPGQMFRHMLAGAILGGAMGYEKGGNFVQGMSRGGAAVSENERSLDVQRRSRAEQDFKNQIEAQKNVREQQAFETEQTVRKANIAALNAQEYLHYKQAEGMDRAYHDTEVDKRKPEADLLRANGISPKATLLAKDLPKYIADHPGASTLRKIPTSVEEYTDQNGHTQFDYVYSLFDVAGAPKIKLTPEYVASLKAVGYPGAGSVIKPGDERSVEEYAAIQNQYMGLYKQKKDEEILEATLAKEKAQKREADAGAYEKTQHGKLYASQAGGALAQNEDGSWNQDSLPVSLVEGTMDPSQLSKRTSNYNLVLQQANKYSREKYGKRFDIAQASNDYRFATNPNTQNVLKYLNSLTGTDNKSGNLQEVVNLSDKISRTDFPALNNVEAWARLQTGDPVMASYYATVTEVADQVAKIMQGGGSGTATSDAKMKQAQDLFSKGFSKKQINSIATEMRSLLANRKVALIGDNRYLRKQYAQSLAVPYRFPDGTTRNVTPDQVEAAKQANATPVQ